MNPRIENLSEKKMVGQSMIMSFSDNRTAELWGSFMPKRKDIQNAVGAELYSIEVYSSSFFTNFDPERDFEKWAAVEVLDLNNIPEEMEALIIPEGQYVVFIHKGPASRGIETYEYIFKTWLPQSEFLVDDRPHFAVMGEKYKHEDESSEEEIWIPIKNKI